MDPKLSLENIAEKFASCSCLKSGVHVFLLVLRIRQRYTGDDEKAMELIAKIIGEDFVHHAIVVFTGEERFDKKGNSLENYISKLPDLIKTIIKSCRGDVIAISNKGKPDERMETARKIVDKIQNLVRQNGRSDKHYRMAVFHGIERHIEEVRRRVRERNAPIQEEILHLTIEKVRLTRDDQHEQRQNIERKIQDLETQLIDEDTAQSTATAEAIFSRIVDRIRNISLRNAMQLGAGVMLINILMKVFK